MFILLVVLLTLLLADFLGTGKTLWQIDATLWLAVIARPGLKVDAVTVSSKVASCIFGGLPQRKSLQRPLSRNARPKPKRWAC